MRSRRYTLQSEWAKHRLSAECWTSTKSRQWHKAVEAYCHLPGVPMSSSLEGTVTVPTTPGGGKKLHQRKWCRVDQTQETPHSYASRRGCGTGQWQRLPVVPSVVGLAGADDQHIGLGLYNWCAWNLWRKETLTQSYPLCAVMWCFSPSQLIASVLL